MNLRLSLVEQFVLRARAKAKALGKSLGQLVSDFSKAVADADDAERSIEEFGRLSRKGHSQGWRFNREETHERR